MLPFSLTEKFNSKIMELNSRPVAMQKIAYLGIRDVKEHFTKGQGPHAAWPGIEHRSGKPLMDTGLLRTSTRYQITGKTVKLFNNTHYGKYHQFGWGVKKRQWMWISPKAYKKILNTYLDQIMGAYR